MGAAGVAQLMLLPADVALNTLDINPRKRQRDEVRPASLRAYRALVIHAFTGSSEMRAIKVLDRSATSWRAFAHKGSDSGEPICCAEGDAAKLR